MKVVNKPVVEAVLTIEEAKALQALLCYGVDNLTEVFYKHLGETYLKPNEGGLHTLKTKLDRLSLPK